jgi:hypothetical protein
MPIQTLLNQNGDMVPILRIGTASGITLALGSTATNTATTGFRTDVVIISSDVSVNIKFHNSATETFAATTDFRLPANSIMSFDISGLGKTFMSVRTTTGTATGTFGNIWIGEAV